MFNNNRDDFAPRSAAIFRGLLDEAGVHATGGDRAAVDRADAVLRRRTRRGLTPARRYAPPMRVLSVSTGPSVGRRRLFETVAVEAGHRLERWRVADGSPEADPTAYDAIMVFGGAMHPDQDARHPWLAGEAAFLDAALEARVPLLGVCLGSQLIARAAGAAIGPAPADEVGWFPVELTDAGRADPVLRALPPRRRGVPVALVHVRASRPAAVVLATSRVLHARRTAIDGHAWGIQFHAEVTRAMIEAWIARGAVELPMPTARAARRDRRGGSGRGIGTVARCARRSSRSPAATADQAVSTPSSVVARPFVPRADVVDARRSPACAEQIGGERRPLSPSGSRRSTSAARRARRRAPAPRPGAARTGPARRGTGRPGYAPGADRTARRARRYSPAAADVEHGQPGRQPGDELVLVTSSQQTPTIPASAATDGRSSSRASQSVEPLVPPDQVDAEQLLRAQHPRHVRRRRRDRTRARQVRRRREHRVEPRNAASSAVLRPRLPAAHRVVRLPKVVEAEDEQSRRGALGGIVGSNGGSG